MQTFVHHQDSLKRNEINEIISPINSLFIGSNVCKNHQQGRGYFFLCLPCEVPIMFRTGVIPLFVALVQVSSPDALSYCSLEVLVGATKAPIDLAKDQGRLPLVLMRKKTESGGLLMHCMGF